MVPTLTCGFFLRNFSFAMVVLLASAASLVPRPPSEGAGLLRHSESLCNELRRDVLRHRSVMVELHRVERPSLGRRAERSGIPEHLGEGNMGRDDLETVPGLHPQDLPPPGRQVAD